jgi:aryl-alcohol dehydrogenase-like predicted oxidoreductase
MRWPIPRKRFIKRWESRKFARQFCIQEAALSMNSIPLGTTGLSAPRIGFGCAALLGRTGRKDSLRALEAAWEAGVRFFDTARMYGYGESEALLGEFLRGRRHEAIIATKFGILPAKQAAWKGVAKSAARSLLKLAPGMHKTLQKTAASQFTHGQFTISVLQQSIEESLRKLSTETVDMLFLHSPPVSVLEQHDLLDAMRRLVEQGKVRVAGLSGDPATVAVALRRNPPQLGAMQFPCNVFDVSAATGFSQIAGGAHALVANHPFGGVARVGQTREALASLAANSRIPSPVREKLSGADDGLLADVVLNVILRDTGIHVVIPAMMKPHHIQLNVEAVTKSRFTSEEIALIRQELAAAAGHGAAQ